MKSRTRKSNNPAGRRITVGGTSKAGVLSVRIPAVLRKQAEERAARAGISISDWWRRAAEQALAR